MPHRQHLSRKKAREVEAVRRLKAASLRRKKKAKRMEKLENEKAS